MQNFTNSQQAYTLLAQLLENLPPGANAVRRTAGGSHFAAQQPTNAGLEMVMRKAVSRLGKNLFNCTSSAVQAMPNCLKQQQFTQTQQALEADFSKIKHCLRQSNPVKTNYKCCCNKVAKHQESTEENELLLTQLHQVQEELERHYLDGQKPQAIAGGSASPSKAIAHSSAE